MKVKAIGFVVVNKVYPVPLELCDSQGHGRVAPKTKDSTLWYGTVGTIFKSKKSALKAVERTQKRARANKSCFDGQEFTITPVAL